MGRAAGAPAAEAAGVGGTAGAPASESAGFAVVELFTSEGCSSCPPADEALSRLSALAAADHLPVYALEWHVDYWDYLGWKDPFDSHLATERQYAYARALPSDVYTPQVVINGTVVPSWAGDAGELERDARRLAASPSPAAIHLKVLPSQGASALRVRVESAGAAAGAQVLVALVEDGLQGRPNAGENSGRELLHSSVVRSVAVLPAGGGETLVSIPAGVDLSRASLVGLLQERSMRIVAADRASPAPRVSAKLSGRLVDPSGRGLPGFTVQACSGSVCVPAVSDANGAFTFDDLAPGSWSLVAGPKVKPRDISLAAGQSIDLGTLLIASR